MNTLAATETTVTKSLEQSPTLENVIGWANDLTKGLTISPQRGVATVILPRDVKKAISMRIQQIRDGRFILSIIENGYPADCTTSDPTVIARWLSRFARMVVA